MHHIVLAGPAVPGEWAPLVTIGRALEADGHRVTAVIADSAADIVAPSGLEVEPVLGTGDVDIRRLAELHPEMLDLPPGPPLLTFEWIHGFIDPMAGQRNALQGVLDRHPDSVLVANSLFTGAWPTALGAPGRAPLRRLAIGANPLVLASDDTTFLGPVPVTDPAEQVAANRAANAGFADALAAADTRLASNLAALGATRPSPRFLEGIYSLPDAFAALTVPGFEFARSDAPASLRLVGALPADAGTGWTPPEWWEELKSDRPVVVVSQGTYANADLGQLVGPTLRALADEDVLVVVALGRPASGAALHLPVNARAADYIPFGPLFAETDIFITNGGMGGTQQALAAGVPVVVAGDTEDKPGVAARVAAHGVGIDLATGRPDPDRIAEAVRMILSDPSFAERAGALREVYAAHDALGEIRRLVEVAG